MSRKFNEQKQPSEKYLVGVDFANDLAVGEVISTPLVVAYDSDGGDVSAALLFNSAQVGTVSGKTFTPDANGTWVVITIQAGVDGETYKITFKATTDTPHIFEADILLKVVDG